MDVVKTLCPPVRRKRKSRVVELLILINVHVGLAALFGPDGRPLNATTFAVTTENPSSSQSMIGNTSDLDDATATIIPTAPTTFRSETVADSVHGNATTFELSSSVTGQTTAAAATEFIDYGRSNLTAGVVSASTLHTTAVVGGDFDVDPPSTRSIVSTTTTVSTVTLPSSARCELAFTDSDPGQWDVDLRFCICEILCDPLWIWELHSFITDVRELVYREEFSVHAPGCSSSAPPTCACHSNVTYPLGLSTAHVLELVVCIANTSVTTTSTVATATSATTSTSLTTVTSATSETQTTFTTLTDTSVTTVSTRTSVTPVTTTSTTHTSSTTSVTTSASATPSATASPTHTSSTATVPTRTSVTLISTTLSPRTSRTTFELTVVPTTTLSSSSVRAENMSSSGPQAQTSTAALPSSSIVPMTNSTMVSFSTLHTPVVTTVSLGTVTIVTMPAQTPLTTTVRTTSATATTTSAAAPEATGTGEGHASTNSVHRSDSSTATGATVRVPSASSSAPALATTVAVPASTNTAVATTLAHATTSPLLNAPTESGNASATPQSSGSTGDVAVVASATAAVVVCVLLVALAVARSRRRRTASTPSRGPVSTNPVFAPVSGLPSERAVHPVRAHDCADDGPLGHPTGGAYSLPSEIKAAAADTERYAKFGAVCGTGAASHGGRGVAGGQAIVLAPMYDVCDDGRSVPRPANCAVGDGHAHGDAMRAGENMYANGDNPVQARARGKGVSPEYLQPVLMTEGRGGDGHGVHYSHPVPLDAAGAAPLSQSSDPTALNEDTRYQRFLSAPVATAEHYETVS